MMQSEHLLKRLDIELNNRRVLAMLPSHTEDRAYYLVQLLKAAKARWGWHIDLMCRPSDRATFNELVAPEGTLFVPPNFLDQAAWELDPEEAADVDHLLREAEMAARVPIGQFVLAAQGSIGCAFVAPVRRLSFSPIREQVLADNTEPFKMIRRLFHYANEMIETSAPDILLAYEWEKPWRSTVWLAAARRGIPRIAIRRSKINADHYYWTTDRVLFNTEARDTAISRRAAGVRVSDAAKAQIQAFRQQPTTVKYIHAKWQYENSKSWLKWHLNWGRNAAKQLLRGISSRGRPGKKLPFKKVFDYNFQTVLGRRHQRFFRTFDGAALEGMKYVYFPMHKETDLPLIFQAPRWHDQRNTIQLLASALPSGYRLLVREHRFNIGHRPTRYYRELSRLPNIVLIDAFDSQFKYIRNADLIVTENGSSGWEGLLLGRRVLTLSRTAYDGAGLARRLEDPDQLGIAILETLAAPAVVDPDEHDRKLGTMIDAEMATTFPMTLDGIPAALNQLSSILSSLLPKRAVRPFATSRSAGI